LVAGHGETDDDITVRRVVNGKRRHPVGSAAHESGKLDRRI
jgi:hypothetical protein